MKKFIAAAKLNFKARSFQTAQALWTYIFYSFDEVVKAREKLYSIQI